MSISGHHLSLCSEIFFIAPVRGCPVSPDQCSSHLCICSTEITLLLASPAMSYIVLVDSLGSSFASSLTVLAAFIRWNFTLQIDIQYGWTQSLLWQLKGYELYVYSGDIFKYSFSIMECNCKKIYKVYRLKEC